VYVIGDPESYICVGCILQDGTNRSKAVAGIVNHLKKHIEVGHLVPDRAFKSLEGEEDY